jgi:HlyD family secretion protein
LTTLQKSLIGVGAVVVAGVIVGASALSKPKEKGEEVFMAKAAKKDLTSFVQATGRIEAKTKVNVQSSVIGEIISLPVKEGEVVKKGDLLVQVDPERYRSEVDRLQSVVRSQEIAIEQSQVALANAERQYKRNASLFQTGGLVSQEAYDLSELDFRSRTIDLKSMKEQMAQAVASLDKARDELKKTTLRSPIDGTVTQLNAEQGEITLTGTMNNPGTVIMVVSDMGEILATVDVDESRVTQVELGQKARIVVDAVGEAHPYTGTVVEIAGSAVQRTGQQTQVFEVKVALDKVDAKLRPGMTAKARIETQNAPGSLTVPIQAVMLRPKSEVEKAASGKKDGGENPKGDSKTASQSQAAVAAAGAKGAAETTEAVFVVENKKAHLRAVKSGISDETSVVLLEGVKEGETVVTGPYRALRDLKEGELVREKKEAGASKDGESGVQVEVD